MGSGLSACRVDEAIEESPSCMGDTDGGGAN